MPFVAVLLVLADTLHFSCAAPRPALPANAVAGAFVIRNQFDGEAFESSDHTIAMRDTTIGGVAAILWDAQWVHRRGNLRVPETIALCRDGFAPLSLTAGSRAGTRTTQFRGRLAEWRGPEGATHVDTLPEPAFPREAQHLLAVMLAAGPDRSVTIPVYRSEADAPAGRFAYVTADVSQGRAVTTVRITGFGGTLEYEVDRQTSQVKIVRLALAGGMIEEVRR